MIYTKKGDDGKTSLFSCNQRISKSSAITEALGCLDEINSYLGVIKAKSSDKDLIHRIQNNLFTIQAQVAGANKKINDEEIENIEKIISDIEKKLPEIKSFLISGANEFSANFDFARTLARRAERRVVAVSEEGIVKIDSKTLIYLNRLSSLLYVLARLAAQESGKEESPKY
jgi:cob(I)alamin adenosyltransferase